MNRLALSVAAGLLLGLAPHAMVYACTEPVGGIVISTPAERTQAADVVLLGTILHVDAPQPGFQETATVLVDQYLKGQAGPSIVHVTGFGSTAFCLSPVQVGKTRVIYAARDPQSGDLTVSYLEAASGTSPVEPQILAEIAAAARQQPVQPTGSAVPFPTLDATLTVESRHTDAALTATAALSSELNATAATGTAPAGNLDAGTTAASAAATPQVLPAPLAGVGPGLACAVMLGVALASFAAGIGVHAFWRRR